jgi:CRISPR-associated protein Csb3
MAVPLRIAPQQIVLLDELARRGMDALALSDPPLTGPALHAALTTWKVTPRQGNDGVVWGPWKLDWPDRVPRLKTWAGQVTLAGLIRERQKALKKNCKPSEAVLACTATAGGASGLDASTALTPLDIGFSPDAHGIEIEFRVGAELLAMIGLQVSPVAVSPDGRTLWLLGGVHPLRFRVEKRGKYQGAYSLFAQPCDLPTLETPPPPDDDE